MENKDCVSCKRTLPTSEFYPRKDSKLGLSGECRSCKTERSKAHYVANTKRHAALVKARYDVHGRFARYGMSLESYDALLLAQGGKCALCKTEKPGGKGKWHIDHAGGTNRAVNWQCEADAVRGLLCHRCNVSLGHYEKLLKRIGEKPVLAYIKRKE